LPSPAPSASLLPSPYSDRNHPRATNRQRKLGKRKYVDYIQLATIFTGMQSVSILGGKGGERLTPML